MSISRRSQHRLSSERWYAGFCHRGSPESLIEEISKKVEKHNLGKIIPLVRIEKNPSSRKEFYFFIAIESENPGYFPQEFIEFLQPMPCFQRQAVLSKNTETQPFYYDQIQDMIGQSHKVCDYTSPIPYRSSEPSFDDSKKFLQELREADQESIDHSLNVKLLAWLSVKHCGSWATFQNTCHILGIEHPTRIMRQMILLGHLHGYHNDHAWAVNPTTLIPLGYHSEVMSFYLAGCQTYRLRYDFLEMSGKLDTSLVESQLSLITSFSNVETLQEFQYQYNVTPFNGPLVSQRQMESIPDLEQWKAGLLEVSAVIPSQMEWKQWTLAGFESCILPRESGLYEMYHSPDQTYPSKTMFYDSQKDRWYQGEWYGLRFLALYCKDLLQPCIYEEQLQSLLVLRSQRWPLIYERILTLASGQLPTQKECYNQSYLVYNQVSLQLAETLSNKLYLELER